MKMVLSGSEAARQFRQGFLKRLGQSVEPLDSRPRLRIPLTKPFLHRKVYHHQHPFTVLIGEYSLRTIKDSILGYAKYYDHIFTVDR